MASRARRGPGAGGGVLSVQAAHHYARVYAAARAGCLAELRRMGCGEEEAEEVFAATLERIMRRRDPPAEGFGQAQTVALLKRACRQKLIDERRHRDVIPMVPLIDAVAPADRTSASPVEAAEDREAVEIGREAVASLPARDRALFRERHEVGLDPEEILRRNPGLSMRTYRKVMQRANARALDAYEKISSGDRCAELRRERLRRYVAGEADEGEARGMRAHLRRCRACRLEAARMRGHLQGVATGLAAALSNPEVRGGGLGERADGLLELAGNWGETLADATRAARERLRELALRVATGFPGSAGEGAAGQAAGALGAKAASVCAAGAVAAGCLAAGVVPGVGGVELAGDERAADRTRARSPAPPPYAGTAGSPRRSRARSATPASDSQSAESRSPAGSAAKKPVRPTRGSTISGRQTGAELGAEAEGAGTPLPRSSLGTTSREPSVPADVASGPSDVTAPRRGSGVSSEFGL